MLVSFDRADLVEALERRRRGEAFSLTLTWHPDPAVDGRPIDDVFEAVERRQVEESPWLQHLLLGEGPAAVLRAPRPANGPSRALGNAHLRPAPLTPEQRARKRQRDAAYKARMRRDPAWRERERAAARERMRRRRELGLEQVRKRAYASAVKLLISRHRNEFDGLYRRALQRLGSSTAPGPLTADRERVARAGIGAAE